MKELSGVLANAAAAIDAEHVELSKRPGTSVF
jgi:hypothetical protein